MTKRRFSQDFSEGGRTQQHFKDAHNVNNIVAAYRTTGIDPYAHRLAQQTFGYASSKSFSDAMLHIAEVKSAFQEQPATTRQQFKNDPGLWLDHITGPILPIDDQTIVEPEPTEAPKSNNLDEDPPFDPDV